MKKEAAAGFSPGTMRKAQKVGMGQNASLGMVEDAIRAVEGAVISGRLRLSVVRALTCLPTRLLACH
jgi:hypothetical protein